MSCRIRDPLGRCLRDLVNCCEKAEAEREALDAENATLRKILSSGGSSMALPQTPCCKPPPSFEVLKPAPPGSMPEPLPPSIPSPALDFDSLTESENMLHVTCHCHALVKFDNGSTTWFCDHQGPDCSRHAEGPSVRWSCPQCDYMYDLCRACAHHFKVPTSPRVSSPRMPEELPYNILIVHSPDGQQDSSGRYELQEEEANGMPVWRRAGAGNDRWLYSGTAGKWHIGAADVKKKKFNCNAGFIYSKEMHDGDFPHTVVSWQYYDGNEFQDSPGFAITTAKDNTATVCVYGCSDSADSLRLNGALEEKAGPMHASPPRISTPLPTRTEAKLIRAFTDSLHNGERSFCMPDGVQWKWEHKTGFKDYKPDQNEKIERAFQKGYSKVRLKSGKAGKTPMEVFFIDLIQYDPMSGNSRKIKREGPLSLQLSLKRFFSGIWLSWNTGMPWRESFEHYQERRRRIEEGAKEKHYNVTDYYSDEGCFQRIARSREFFWLMGAIVVFNIAWLWHELDANPAVLWPNASIEFQVMANMFCAVFSMELFIRFAAFEIRRNALKDVWFVVDLLLVVLLIVETWAIPLGVIATGHAGSDLHDVDGLGLVRAMRLLRIARVARLLRAVPEMFTLFRGLHAAMSSVFFTFILLFIFLFIFAMLFRAHVALTPHDNGDLEAKYFSSCMSSFWTLLAYGTFVDEVSALLLQDLIPNSALLTFYFVVFTFLSGYIVLNMLIGIICQVVSRVKQEQDELFEHLFLENYLMDILECYDEDGNKLLGKEEFKLLMNNPEAIECIRDFGTDVKGLITLTDVLFDNDTDESEVGHLSFHEFLAVVTRLKGNHHTRVSDLIDVRAYTRQRFDELQQILEPLVATTS